MISVLLDVPAARDAATRLDALSTLAHDRSAALRRAAARAHEELPSLTGVTGWTAGFRARAGDLHARVDLALAVSGGDEHSLTGPVRYDVLVDDGDATRERLGTALAELAGLVGPGDDLTPVRRLHERLDRWADDPVVATALVDALGGPGLVGLLARCGALGASGTSPAARDLPVRLAHLVRRAARTAARAWDDEAAARGRALAVTGTAGERAALSFLVNGGGLPAPVLAGLADALEEHELVHGVPTGGVLPGTSWLGLEGADRHAAVDAAAAVLQSLADTPDAALAWLTGGGAPRLGHWLRRTWTADGGRRLGDLLSQATTSWQVLDDPDLDAAAQAARVLDAARLVAAVLADIDPGATAAGPGLAHVLATWLHGLDASVNTPVPEPAGRVARGLRDATGAPLPPAPLAAPDRLRVVLRTALASDEGFARLRAGLTAHAAGVLRSAAGVGPTRLADALLAQSALTGLLAAALDGARRQAWVDLGVARRDSDKDSDGDGWQALLPDLAAYADRTGGDDDALGRQLWRQWLVAVARLEGELGTRLTDALDDDVRDGCTSVFGQATTQTGRSPT